MEIYMDIEFRKFTDYNRGIMYEILKDAYSFDERFSLHVGEINITFSFSFLSLSIGRFFL